MDRFGESARCDSETARPRAGAAPPTARHRVTRPTSCGRCARGGTRMDNVVVDASIAVKWVVEEEGSEDARTLLGRWLEAGIQPLAPSWFTCEIANILYRKALRGDLTFEDAAA